MVPRGDALHPLPHLIFKQQSERARKMHIHRRRCHHSNTSDGGEKRAPHEHSI